MQVGDLRNRIIINKVIKSMDENGYEKITTELITKCWAKINNLYGQELYQAINVKLENTLNITIRYSNALKNLNSKDIEVMWNERSFNVVFIDYHSFDKKYITFKCLEVI